MTRNMTREMLQQETIRRLQMEKKRLAAQKEALIRLSVALLMILGYVLITL